MLQRSSRSRRSPAGDTGQDQRHPHASHGPGGGIGSDQRGAARADRVDHERDGACQFAGYRQAVAELDPPHVGQLERVANRSHSALPSNRKPSCIRRGRRCPDARACWEPSPAGRVACHRSGAAPDGRAAGLLTPASVAPQSRPARGGQGAPHAVRGADGGRTALARSPRQGIAILMSRRHCARHARRSQHLSLFPLAGEACEPSLGSRSCIHRWSPAVVTGPPISISKRPPSCTNLVGAGGFEPPASRL